MLSNETIVNELLVIRETINDMINDMEKLAHRVDTLVRLLQPEPETKSSEPSAECEEYAFDLKQRIRDSKIDQRRPY